MDERSDIEKRLRRKCRGLSADEISDAVQKLKAIQAQTDKLAISQTHRRTTRPPRLAEGAWEEMSNASLANKIANQLNRACALEITTTAIEAIEECLGEAMRTEKDLRLTSKMALEDERERDLEVWRQAYNAAIPPGANEDIVKGIADCALEAYRAKREELRGE